MSQKIKCPRCRKPVTLEGNPYRPFCSERCKTSDLGAWADGSYFIAGEEVELPEGDGPEGPTYH